MSVTFGTGFGYSRQNPCPSGMGRGWMNVSNVFYVVCSSDFNPPEYDGTALGLGLGLGLGIPLLCVFGCLCYCKVRNSVWPRTPTEQAIRLASRILHLKLANGQPFPITNGEQVQYRLKSEVLTHMFKNGQLTDDLKKHIMMIRVREGRNLTEFVAYAKELGHKDITDFCENLQPWMIPRDVQQEALRPSTSEGVV